MCKEKKRGVGMATKSILKNVDIRNKKIGRDFVNALENAHDKVSKEVILSKPCTHVNRQDIRKLFGE